jgi:hypothetical protein
MDISWAGIGLNVVFPTVGTGECHAHDATRLTLPNTLVIFTCPLDSLPKVELRFDERLLGYDH